MDSETGPRPSSVNRGDPTRAFTNVPIADGVRIGHVHLKVADLERALDFYCGVLGFTLTQKLGDAAPSFRQAATIITLGSIHGKAAAAMLRQQARPAFIMRRSSIRRAQV